MLNFEEAKQKVQENYEPLSLGDFMECAGFPVRSVSWFPYPGGHRDAGIEMKRGILKFYPPDMWIDSDITGTVYQLQIPLNKIASIQSDRKPNKTIGVKIVTKHRGELTFTFG